MANFTEPNGLEFNSTVIVNQTTTNYTINVTTEVPHSDSGELDSLFNCVGITVSVIALIGVVFNLLNIYVLVKMVRRRRGISPTYHLLIAMGIADLLVLVIISFFYLNVFARNPPLHFSQLHDGHHDFYHVLHYIWNFAANPFSIASNWLVVATTIFRFLAVAFPMKVCQW